MRSGHLNCASMCMTTATRKETEQTGLLVSEMSELDALDDPESEQKEVLNAGSGP